MSSCENHSGNWHRVAWGFETTLVDLDVRKLTIHCCPVIFAFTTRPHIYRILVFLEEVYHFLQYLTSTGCFKVCVSLASLAQLNSETNIEIGQNSGYEAPLAWLPATFAAATWRSADLRFGATSSS
jgi:hypothetical protein